MQYITLIFLIFCVTLALVISISFALSQLGIKTADKLLTWFFGEVTIVKTKQGRKICWFNGYTVECRSIDGDA